MNNINAKKFDSEKSRVDLIDPDFIFGIGDVLKMGVAKYGEDNWRDGIKLRRHIGAALRHLLAFSSGEDNDAESSLSHLYHAATNLMFLAWTQKHKPELDDRFAMNKEG